MESVNHSKISKAIYKLLLDKKDEMSEEQVEAVIKSSAEGYSFPTNLDCD